MRATKPFTFVAMSRRAALTGAALAAMATLSGCGAGAAKPAEGDMSLGAAEGAKVTVVEYASVTCSHCAEWQKDTWPGFKAKYIDTNKVRYTFREFPTAPVPVATAGFLIARCAGEDKYFDVIHTIMARQDQLFGGIPPHDFLLSIATEAGLTEQQFEACIQDDAAVAKMETRIKAGLDAGVTGTPTFLVNGEKVIDSSLSGLSEKIDAALAK
ncbi:DsbA family protein [soil metagenome]